MGKTDPRGYQTADSYEVTGEVNKIGYGDSREDWLGITRMEHNELGRTVVQD